MDKVLQNTQVKDFKIHQVLKELLYMTPKVIRFNSHNKLFQYASTDMDKVLLKYTGKDVLSHHIQLSQEAVQIAFKDMGKVLLRYTGKRLQIHQRLTNKDVLSYSTRTTAVPVRLNRHRQSPSQIHR